MSSSSLGIRMKPELKLDNLYRFIQLENGEFEFSLVTPFSPSHRAMSKDRKVIGAGYITVFDKRARLDDTWSSTLGIGCSDECKQALEKLLELPVVGKTRVSLWG